MAITTLNFPNSVQCFDETVTPLGISATFTGSAHDTGPNVAGDGTATGLRPEVSPIRTYTASAYSDVASAANGFRIEHSKDSITWYPAASVLLAAGVPQQLSVVALARYYRTVLVNAAGAQAVVFVGSAFSIY